MILGIHQFGVFGGGIVQNLQFHSGPGRSARSRVVNAESIVSTRREKKFEFKDIVGILLFGHEVRSLANDCPVLHYVVSTLPSGQILPVEEGNGLSTE